MNSTAELKKNILISLIFIFFLGVNVEAEKAWLELYSEKYDNNPVVDIIKDYNKDLWLATEVKLYKINDDNTLKEIEIDNKYINKKILKIYPSKKKSIYVLFNEGSGKCIITEYINSGWKELGELEMSYNSFFEDSKCRLWSMDYKSNILLFKDNKWETIKYNSGFLESYDEYVRQYSITNKLFNPLNFLEDSKGRVWIYSSVIGVIGGQNSYISMTDILCYHNDEINVFPLTDLPNKLITFVIEIKPDIFWIGIYGEGGIFAFKVSGKSKLELGSLGYSPNNFVKDFLFDFYKDSKGKIWIITMLWSDVTFSTRYQSLWCIKEEKIEMTKYGIDEIPVFLFRSRHPFCEDLNSNIFVGTFNKGVLLINSKGEVKEINRLNGLKISTVKSIISDKNGNIFFIPKDRNYQINSIQILSNEWVDKTDEIDKIKAWRIVYTKYGIKKDSKGNLWWLIVDNNNVESLIKYDGKKMQTIAMSDIRKKIEEKNQGFNIDYFTIDSKDMLWFYIWDKYVFIYNGINFEEAIDIKEAYRNISLNEDEDYKLGSGDFREWYLVPIITNNREIFYSNYSNTIYYFNCTKWLEYKIKSIFGDGFFLEYPLFINNEGYVVSNTHSNNGEKRSYIFKNGSWQESHSYFYNPYIKKEQDFGIEYKDSKSNIFIFSRQDGLQYKDSNNNLYKIDDTMCPIPINEGAIVLKILEDIRGDIWFGYSRYNGYNAMCEGSWVVLDISKLKELIKEPIIKVSSIEVQDMESDYTQKLDKIFEKLKSNDDKIVKEAIEEFISLKTISKEYLIKKLNEISDEVLKWKTNAILSRIE